MSGKEYSLVGKKGYKGSLGCFGTSFGRI